MASPRLGCNDGLALASRMGDRRSEGRTGPARVVRVAHDGKAAYARCRDFSDMGLRLDLTAPLELNAGVTVALTPEIMLCGTVAWVAGRQCGIVFDGPVDSASLLDAAGPPPRALIEPGTLDMLGRRGAQPAPKGAAARRSGFEPGLAVKVMVGPNEEQRGVVRWAQGNIAELELSHDEAGTVLALPSPA